jgi:ADP-ribose pyrophosphatase
MEQHPELFVNVPGGIEILNKEEQMDTVEQARMQELAEAGLPAEQGHVGLVFEDLYCIVLRDAVEFPDGGRRTYLRITTPLKGVQGVAILPRYRDKVLLIRHFRHATRRWHLEIPRGFSMPGLSNEENARKELKEEIEADATRLEDLGHLYPNTGMGTEYVALYYAEVAAYGSPQKSEGIAEILPVSLEDLETMIRDDLLTDGYTLAAYTRARLKGLLA